MAVVTLTELLEAGVHFGHQARRWNPKMFPYIYTEKNGIHIIDLVQTAQLLTEACEFVKKASSDGKKVLFLGTKRQAAGIVAQEAQRCDSYYVNQRWLGGMLTNWVTIKSRVNRLRQLEEQDNSGIIDQLPKKEAAVLRRELAKLRKHLNGIKDMTCLPDIVVIVDQKRETTAIQECLKLGIPTVCILDTNCSPEIINIPIPANDDAIRSIKLIVGKIADAIHDGKCGQINSKELPPSAESES
nr:ribosomal protein S2 [Pyropia sp. Myanmar_A]BED43442.1 ribosomal protein S2 [Pyropia sp. Myanmar_B]BED43639.1 ribosomal protein S2 [Pyropia sp. Myanmar_C]